MKLHTVAVLEGRRGAGTGPANFHTAYAAEGLHENAGFGFDLGFVGEVLQGAASTAAIIGTEGRTSLRGRVNNFQGLGAGPAFVLF
jgi:hypothetical protein